MKNKFTNPYLYYIILTFAFSIFMVIGCATSPLAISPQAPTNIHGIYHRIAKGETIWRISKIYNMDLEELIRINHISDVANIETGQLIFIPYGYRQSASNLPQDDFIWPLKGEVISVFGQAFNNMVNRGINIKPYRTKEVVSARAGKVVFYSPNFQGYGKTIIIDHQDGFLTVYARNADVYVKPADLVAKGSVIARAGSTGRDKNTYLHFEIRKNHIAQNPNFYLSH
ncbi:MAG: hypothetical protein A2166_00160 [Omnitrophica WOR_2 bacterium RBG_13_41_10]|nr:MAG: hypothetical protein A2166_00160 [Omnitrophica WOR_2 bacterium RBG_13_41_10]